MQDNEILIENWLFKSKEALNAAEKTIAIEELYTA
jgi:hypothetical protein